MWRSISTDEDLPWRARLPEVAGETAMSGVLHSSEFKPVNLVEQIADFVEQAILDGIFEMGHQLVEQEISNRFKTSRQPIREAFRVLEKRGLVTVVPRKGTFVATITWKDFEQFFPVIAVLDGLAGRIAYNCIEPDCLQTLESTLKKLVRDSEEESVKKYLVTHAEFHSILNESTGNRMLIDTLSTLRTAHSWFIMTHMAYSGEQYRQSIGYHNRIIDELKRKTIGEDAMEKLMREHVNNSSGLLI
jgi:DNA-binding GntR family transcriptional regulator